MADRLCGLERMKVVTGLARTIYYARQEVYGLEAKHWDALAPVTRREYVQRAQEFLEALRPYRTGVIADGFEAGYVWNQHATALRMAKATGRPAKNEEPV